MKEVFTLIYETRHWGDGESVSGPGSSQYLSNDVVIGIEKLIQELGIHSVLDLPCGDFNWMSQVRMDECTYLGADIVEELIYENMKRYASDDVSFQTLDITKDPLPNVDLMISRDCLVHFSFEDIWRALANIRKAKIKYILMTSFTKPVLNYDITTGDWRPLNFQGPPFHLPPPRQIIVEGKSTSFSQGLRGKSLCLWAAEAIPVI